MLLRPPVSAGVNSSSQAQPHVSKLLDSLFNHSSSCPLAELSWDYLFPMCNMVIESSKNKI